MDELGDLLDGSIIRRGVESATSSEATPRVLEHYGSVRSRPKLRGAIERMLWHLPRGYFARFGHVTLRDSGSLTRKERAKREKAGPSRHLLGTYYGPTAGQPAHIDLFVDAIFDGRSTLLVRVPPVRDVLLGRALYHELGHHLQRGVHPEHRDREEVAEEWRRRLLRTYFRKTYWYLLPVLWLGVLVARVLPRPGRTRKG